MQKTIPQKMTRASVKTGEETLARKDKIMARLIARHPSCNLWRKAPPPFHSLAVSIINQQLSQKAADAIENRIAQLMPPPFCAAALQKIAPQKFRDCGLSGNKVRFLFAVAAADFAGELSMTTLQKMDDEAITEKLTAIAGVGRWTAEMFLMFAMRRPNVLSLGDVGLRRAARNLYGKPSFDGDDAGLLQTAAKKWQPYCTVACWHLWRAVD